MACSCAIYLIVVASLFVTRLKALYHGTYRCVRQSLPLNEKGMGISGKGKSLTVPNILKQFKDGTLSDQDSKKFDEKDELVAEQKNEKLESTSRDGNMKTNLIETTIEETHLTYQKKIESIVMDVVKKERKRLEADSNGSVYVNSIKWMTQRVEVILSSNSDIQFPEGPPMKIIERTHKALYAQLQMQDEQLQFTDSYELLVASPGIRDELCSDRDFNSFQGFQVTVMTTEEYKKKIEFKGTLIERNEDFVRVELPVF